MVENAIECPSEIDTAAFKNPELMMLRFRNSIMRSISVSMPCKIVSYDRTTHLATVKPLLNFKYFHCPVVESDEIPDVEILRMMAGGFLIDFPIAAGDTGWLIAVDRDALDVKTRSGTALPRSSVVNSYKSGFWIPDQWGDDTKLNISGVDENRLVIMSKDGAQKISLGGSDINVVATSVNITGDVNVTGNLAVSGTIKETGADVTLSTHTHKENGVVGNPESQSPTPGT